MTLEDFITVSELPTQTPPLPPMNVIDIDSRHRQPRPFCVPDCVKLVSLAHILLPEDLPAQFDPKNGVSDYILLSQDGCVTDFHPDFSYTSVFYMVADGGKKDFFLVRSSPNNRQIFDEWTKWTEDTSDHTDRAEW